MKKNRKITGVQEWSDCSISIQYGCSNNCSYCWAKKIHNRFNRISKEEWDKPKIKTENELKHLARNKKVMCFGTHDIDENNLNQCIEMIKRLLERKNHILIVSKPRLSCIQALISNFIQYKERIEFRFTIGSCNDDTLKFWEKNTTNFTERMECVKWTISNGFKTSISCEPLLDIVGKKDQFGIIRDCFSLINMLLKLKVCCIGRNTPDGEISEIWIGSMNYMKDSPVLDYEKILDYYVGNTKIRFKESFMKHLKNQN